MATLYNKPVDQSKSGGTTPKSNDHSLEIINSSDKKDWTSDFNEMKSRNLD